MSDYVWIWVKNPYSKEMNNYPEKELRKYKVKERKKNCIVLHNGKQYPYTQYLAGRNRNYNKRNMKNADTQNLDKWGTNKEHNILYISGKSGSGKSTAALAMSDSNTNVIHLDSYFELKNKSEANKNKNERFNNFLKKNGFDINSLNDGKLFKNDIKEYFKKVDKFTVLSEEFAREEYGYSRKIIMEGVQLLDETMYPNKRFFDDKPCILLKTNDDISRKRAKERDSYQ